MKETYENMDLLLKAISYSKCGWKICGDLKDIGLILGVQSGYTKFYCFLREWDGRGKDKHYKMKVWPIRENSVPGGKLSEINRQLTKKIFFLPPPLIKFGLMKNFIKAINQYGKGFAYLRENFSEIHGCYTERECLLDCKLLK